MFDRLIYKIKKPKFCKHCGSVLVEDREYDYSESTGKPIRVKIFVRCGDYGFCFKKRGYFYIWRESVREEK